MTIDEIVRQVRAAIAWTWTNASTFEGDRGPNHTLRPLGRRSPTARALATDWPGDYDLPPGIIKKALAISGLFDLAPFPYSWLQPSLQLSWEQVLRQSPIHCLPDTSPPLTIAVGAAESAEFRRQASTFHALRAERGLPGIHLGAGMQPLHGPDDAGRPHGRPGRRAYCMFRRAVV